MIMIVIDQLAAQQWAIITEEVAVVVSGYHYYYYQQIYGQDEYEVPNDVMWQSQGKSFGIVRTNNKFKSK